MLGHQNPGLGGGAHRVTRLQQQRDRQLLPVHVRFFEPSRLGPDERPPGGVGERGATPGPQRPVDLGPGRVEASTRHQVPGTYDGCLEPARGQRVRRNQQRIPGTVTHQHLPVRGAGLQHRAQPADVRMHRGRRGRWRTSRPQVLEELLERHRALLGDDQPQQEHAPLPGTDLEHAPVAAHLQGAENIEHQAVIVDRVAHACESGSAEG